MILRLLLILLLLLLPVKLQAADVGVILRTSYVGGVSGALDAVECDDIQGNNTNRRIATGDRALVLGASSLALYVFDVTGTSSETGAAPYLVITPDDRADCGGTGQWNLVEYLAGYYTPQLGGNLDLNGNSLISDVVAITDGDITPDVSGGSLFKAVDTDTTNTVINDFDFGGSSIPEGYRFCVYFLDAYFDLDFTSSGLEGNGGADWTNIGATDIACFVYTDQDQWRLTTSAAGGSGDVTAAVGFGTDNVVVRSDGTGKGVQASGLTINDSDLLTVPGGLATSAAGVGTVDIYDSAGDNYLRLTISGDWSANKTVTWGSNGALPTANGGAGVTTKTTATNYTIGTTDPRECYGGVIYATGDGIDITACDDLAANMAFTVITIGAVQVDLDVQSDDKMILDGTTLDDGDKAANTSTSGDIIVCTYYSTDGWCCASGSNDGDLWTDGS